ncbi:hypothetical protein AB0C93_12455 [Streptomyces sp. NPDC048518]|uniref:hypothetical protein n=1 Tax=Streptomyces sp. NPDC048518 TaxID=3155029 RepID=UPI00340C6BDE
MEVPMVRVSRHVRARIRRAVVAVCTVSVLAGTTGAAFPSGRRQPPAVVREAPAPHDPASGTHKLIRDQIDIDLDDEERRRIAER